VIHSFDLRATFQNCRMLCFGPPVCAPCVLLMWPAERATQWPAQVQRPPGASSCSRRHWLLGPRLRRLRQQTGTGEPWRSGAYMKVGAAAEAGQPSGLGRCRHPLSFRVAGCLSLMHEEWCGNRRPVRVQSAAISYCVECSSPAVRSIAAHRWADIKWQACSRLSVYP
jgi:hypothetical protein